MFGRYYDLIQAQLDAEAEFSGGEVPHRLDLRNLLWLCEEGKDAMITNSMPLDKASRWLGFVQGCLAMRGLIDVDTERDFSRPLFHAAYENEGLIVPGTLENG